MPKLSEYVEMAAQEYFRETGRTDLDPRWTAEFFEDSGVLDEYPRQDMVAFHAMVQKGLILCAELADKQARNELAKVIRFVKGPRKG